MESKQTMTPRWMTSPPTEHRNQSEYRRPENIAMHAVPPAYPSTAQLPPITHSTAVQYYRGLVIAKLNFRSMLM